MMDTNDKHIVAIDLGTSGITLTVAKINGEDVQIIYHKVTPSAGIRYSSIFNVMQATESLAKAVRQAEDALGIKITQAVVGMPKYPVRQETSQGKLGKEENTYITAEDVNYLKSIAQNEYPLEKPAKEAIYGAVAQSFSDGENFQIIENDIIGMTGDVLEGNFKVFIGKKSDLNKIDMALNSIGISAMRKFFTAETTAKAVLKDSEMENGVALIDFGAGSTSVTIYHGSIMRHYAAIPFGGKNITDDIKSEGQISEQLAENIKMAFGACMPDRLQNLSEKIIHIRSNSDEPDKQLPVKYLSEIITARVEEIMMAILYEIQMSGFADMLRSGIVVTGGGSQIPNLGAFIYDISGYRTRTGYPIRRFSSQGCEGAEEPASATVMGLLLAAKKQAGINCVIVDEDAVAEQEASEEEDTADIHDTADSGVQDEPQEDGEGQDGDIKDGKLFKDKDIEVVQPKDKEKKKRTHKGPIVIWEKIQKIGDLFEDFYNSVGQDIDKEDV